MGILAGVILFIMCINFPCVGFLLITLKLIYDLNYQINVGQNDKEIKGMLTSLILASIVVNILLFTGEIKISNNWFPSDIDDYTIEEVK